MQSPLLDSSDWCYRRLLGSYPAAFREHFAADMALVFRVMCREAYTESGASGLVRLWLPSRQDSLTGFVLPFVGEQSLRFDLVEVLRLEGLLTTLETVTSASGLTLAVAVLALALLSGLFLAVIVTLIGLAYNLIASATGGLVVEMKTLGGPDGRQAKAPSEPTGTG